MDSASSTKPLRPQQPDFDLLCDIHAKLHWLPIMVQWMWIKSHQDDQTQFQSLTPIVQDNVIANNITKANYLCNHQTPHTNPCFTNEGWSQTLFDKQHIYDYLTQPSITEYGLTKWNHPLHTPIDWPSLKTAIASLSTSQQ